MDWVGDKAYLKPSPNIYIILNTQPPIVLNVYPFFLNQSWKLVKYIHNMLLTDQ